MSNLTLGFKRANLEELERRIQSERQEVLRLATKTVNLEMRIQQREEYCHKLREEIANLEAKAN